MAHRDHQIIKTIKIKKAYRARGCRAAPARGRPGLLGIAGGQALMGASGRRKEGTCWRGRFEGPSRPPSSGASKIRRSFSWCEAWSVAPLPGPLPPGGAVFGTGRAERGFRQMFVTCSYMHFKENQFSIFRVSIGRVLGSSREDFLNFLHALRRVCFRIIKSF